MIEQLIFFCRKQTAILRGRMHDERRRSSSSDSESDTELTELLNHVNRRARAFDPLDSAFKVQTQQTIEIPSKNSPVLLSFFAVVDLNASSIYFRIMWRQMFNISGKIRFAGDQVMRYFKTYIINYYFR